MLNDILIQFAFGFPAGIMSLLLSALGIWRKWPAALIVAGVWAFPANYYLSAAFGVPLYLVGLFQFGAAYMVYKNNERLAWLLSIPLFLCATFMTFLTVLGVLYN